MFGEGKVKSYNQERGFGFIQVENNRKEIFFHISDLPESDVPLRIGETLKFRIVENYGKLKADYIVRVDLEGRDLHPMHIMHEEYVDHYVPPPKVPSSILSKFIALIAILIMVILAYEVFMKYKQHKQTQELKFTQASIEQNKAVAEQIKKVEHLPDEVALPAREDRRVKPMYTESNKSNQQKFSCDGRIHCSEMTSYDEALFFLRNCPGVKMDGNLDGIPCERQFGR